MQFYIITFVLILFSVFVLFFNYAAGKQNALYDRIIKSKKPIYQILPELEKISEELGLKINDRKVLQEYFKRHPYEKEATKQEKIDWWASLESSKRDYLIQLCSKELNNCIETTDEDIEIMYEYKDEF